ncbi:hypothetical protein KXV85_004612, partial [Aspergillus fumigatus]
SHAGLDLRDRRGRGPRGAADRQQRRDVRGDPDGTGDRAEREDGRRVLALQAAAPGRSVPAASDQSRRRPLGGQALPRDDGRPCRRARCQDRQGGVGHQGAGLQEGSVHDPDAADHRGQGDRRRLRRRVRRARLHCRLRRQGRQGTVAHLHHSRRGRAR